DMARMICVNTFALNGNLTVSYKTLIFSNLYLYEKKKSVLDFIHRYADSGSGYQTKPKSNIKV
ncbi:hypothetical protein, partial [Bacteroides stercoris]|uniref:hypothetical protein n=1 Tax=Bacteroides stercoris TaxID=46506 RepID=UPI000B2C71BD